VLKKAGKQATIVLYPRAGHAFFNEQRPSYVADAARDAWDRVTQFLGRTLKGALAKPQPAKTPPARTEPTTGGPGAGAP